MGEDTARVIQFRQSLMKKKFLGSLTILALALAGAFGAPDYMYENTSTVTSPPQIDATNFVNDSGALFEVTSAIFSTSDTLNFTNFGEMFLA